MALRLITTILFLLNFWTGTAPAQFSNSIGNSIECNIYLIYNTVRTAIYIVAIMLIVLGAAVYAAANIMPQQSRGNIQGYGMGMVIGGVSGVIIASIAPYLLDIISGGASSANIAAVAQVCG